MSEINKNQGLGDPPKLPGSPHRSPESVRHTAETPLEEAAERNEVRRKENEGSISHSEKEKAEKQRKKEIQERKRKKS